MSSLRDAMNPLRQMGNEIKADLQRSTTVDKPDVTPAIPVAEPSMGLPETPTIAPVPVEAVAPQPLMTPLDKPKAVRKPRVKAPAAAEAAPVVTEAVTEKPKRAPRKAAADPVIVAVTPAAAPKKRAPAKKKDNA
jgi:sec-independent protein translocase protein TatB